MVPTATDKTLMTFAAIPAPQPSDPDVRMLTTLLASCDPCGYLAAGRTAQRYTEAATNVLATLSGGGGITDVLLTLPEAEVEQAHRFARVALHWWSKRVVSLSAKAPAAEQLQPA